MAYDIHKVGVRNKLEARNEPYFGAPVERGLYVGFRKLAHGGNWVARLRVDYAKQKYKALGAVTELFDYESAKRAALQWRKQIDAGVKTDEVKTVADACRAYVAALKIDGREKAAADANRRFERTVYADKLGAIALEKLSQQDLAAWRHRVERGELPGLPALKGRSAELKPISKATFNRMRTPLVAALNRAVAEGQLMADRARQWNNVKPYRKNEIHNPRKLTLEIHQRREWIRNAPEDLRDLMECIALTGCRPGDPAAVLRRDYDPRVGTVTFRTKGHERTIKVPTAAAAMFERLAKGKAKDEHLFTNGGKPWRPRDWADGAREAANAAGLPEDAVLYTLRHCWITDALVGGVDMLTVAKTAGTSIQMIQDHYGHLVQNDKLSQMVFI